MHTWPSATPLAYVISDHGIPVNQVSSSGGPTVLALLVHKHTETFPPKHSHGTRKTGCAFEGTADPELARPLASPDVVNGLSLAQGSHIPGVDC